MRALGIIAIVLLLFSCQGENTVEPIPKENVSAGPKGKLFIIGGGSRPMEMMEELVNMSVSDNGYILVMSQSSIEPDTSFYYVALQLKEFTDQPVIHVDSVLIQSFSLDSIANADLIYLTGGDQNRFKRNVPESAKEAIRAAYRQGATVAGTSAGAALMSKVMITGDQQNEPEYESTYRRLEYGNAITSEGLGLLDSVLVDQHFVARSRYNRILSVMADLDYPTGAGIEESTALVVLPKGATVVGKGQVLVFSRPAEYTEKNDKIGFKDMNFNAYLQGDTFQLK
ncbi:cyanophycinase [Cryomorphaceae bacterium 1068]|nr:cyanophycinase [Cryomorphaceae bacterium 1068]